MMIRRMAAGLGTLALVLAACGDDGGASQAASSDGGGASAGAGGDCSVGVSWNNFEQPRWAANDKPNMQGTIEAGGGTYTGRRRRPRQRPAADRRRDAHQRRRGRARAARAGHQDAALAAIEVASRTPASRSSPMTGSSRTRSVLYITFDNVGVGRAEAEAHLRGRARRATTSSSRATRATPTPPRSCRRAGTRQACQDKVDAGEIDDPRRPVHRRLAHRDGPEQHGGDHRRRQRRRRHDRRHPGRERQHGARRRRRRSRARASTRSRSAARTATRRTCRTWPPAGSTWTSGRTPTSSARSPARPRSSSARASPWRT